MIRRIKAFATAACWGVVLAGGAAMAAAQASGELAGIVRDATGAVVPGVIVTLTGKTLPAPVAIETDDHGRFAIRLAPGPYEVSAEVAGFEPWRRDVIVSAVGVTLDVTLEMSTRFSDRVTVTATRTGIADIQTTGVAITALDTTTLDQTAVERIEHLAGFVPTLSVSQTPGHTPLLTLRGIGSNAAVPGTQPNVTMQVDGVYLRGPTMGLDFLDVERVEVLRGPQGTLFGRNSIGGTINIVTKQPTNALETKARLTAGNYDKIRVEGAISGPVVRDSVMGSFAFLRGSRDGFVADVAHPDHSLGSEDTWAGRGQLRFVLRSRHELLVSGDYSSARGVPLTLARPLARHPDTPANAPGFEIPDDFWSVRTSDLAEGRNRQAGASARLSLRLGDTATMTSLTAYRDGDHRLFVDADTTELLLATTRTSSAHRQVSQEVTLARRTSKLDGIAGAFWFDERNRAPIEITQPANQFRANSTIDTEAWALFGQVRYLLSDRVAVTGGLRYSHEWEEAHSIGGLFLRATSSALFAYDVIDTAADAAWTPKAVIELEASRDTFLYVSATRGFKSGGINITAREPGTPFRPEFAWSYEAGLKRTLPGGRGRVNASLFYVDYRDLQVVSFAGPGQLDISNAGRATTKGIEVEGALSPGTGIQFLGIFSWLDAVYGQYSAIERGLGRIDATGNRLREAPEWSGGGSARYEFRPSAIGSVSLRGDVSWQSRVFFSPSNVDVQSQPAYALVHARASFVPRSRRWDVAVYVRNLARQQYVTATWLASGDVAFSGRPGEPRHWGTQVTIRR